MPSDPRHEFHPVIAERLEKITQVQTGPGPATVDMAVLREAQSVLSAPVGPPETWDLVVEDGIVRAPGAAVPIRVYRPAGEPAGGSLRPCLVWMHGGGFMVGDLDRVEAHEVARGIAGRADAVVVSVDYRLSVNGVHFPAPHDDVVAAYRWVRQHADKLGVDADEVALGGASAGGNLAAGAALRLRDQGDAVWQVLLAYPVLHAMLPEPSDELAAALALAPREILFPDEMVTATFLNYLGNGLETAGPYAAPGCAEDLRGFPPTYIENDEFDSLRSSGERFADQLRAAGVQVELVTSPGVMHGHLDVLGLDVAHATLDRMAARLQPGQRHSAEVP